MLRLRVEAGASAYPVLIAPGLLARAGEEVRDRLEADRCVVVADRRVCALHGEALRASLAEAGLRVLRWAEVPPGERSKSLARARALYRDLAACGADRWTPVLAFGGGVVGDLAGFAASTFMRGLPIVHLPTSVVAQVDSSIGGKTAVNFAGAKNLVGTFEQPALVLMDPSLLATLPRRDYRAGLAEAVKIGVTLRPGLVERMEGDLRRLRAREPESLVPVVEACVLAKAEIVSRDEKDRDVRAILNYGHTIGHALEAESRGRLRHGEAVAIGMAAAAHLGERMGVTPPEVAARQDALLRDLGLKLARPEADKEVVARKLKLDKKLRGSGTRFVLTLHMGGASVWPHVPDALVLEAIDFVTGRTGPAGVSG